MQKSYQQKLQDFISVGDYIGAKNYLLSIGQDLAKDVDYLYYSAHIARKTGDLIQAEDFCKKTIELSPSSRDANFEMGIIYQTTGEYKKAITFLKKLVENPPKDIHYIDMVDTLNSLALTYKKAGDKVNALKYYNLSLETLAQDIYEHIKGQPIREVEAEYPGNNLEGWMRLAFQIAVKNAAKDGIKTAMIPDGDTAKKIVEQNPFMGFAIYDKDDARYLLPAYFAAFSNALRLDILYSNIVNNIGTLFAETGEIEEAKKCFLEAINFIPPGVKFDNPYINLESLK